MNNPWLTLWTVVFWAALVLFTGLTIAVTIGGFIDIRKMIKQIRAQHRDGPTQNGSRGFEPVVAPGGRHRGGDQG
jgi:hypothetical protein